MFEWRVRVVGLTTALVYLVLFAQLGRIQLVQAERYRLMAERKLTWDELTVSRRGRIVDRKGRVLAVDRPTYDLAAVVGELEIEAILPRHTLIHASLPPAERAGEKRAAIDRLAEEEPLIVDIAARTGIEPRIVARGIYEVMAEAARWKTYSKEHTFLRDVPFEPWVRIKVLTEPPGDGTPQGRSPYPGVRTVTSVRRSYPRGENACHIIGTVGEVDAADWYGLRHAGSLVWKGRRRWRRWGEIEEGLDAEAKMELLDLIVEELGEEPDPKALAPKLTGVRENRRLGVAEDICGARITSALRTPSPERRERFQQALGTDWLEVREWLEELDRVRLETGERIWVEHGRYLKDRTIGQTGIEAIYNAGLRGRHGYKLLVRTLADPGAHGSLEYLTESRPRVGGDVRLTVDLELQTLCESLLKESGYRGAAVFIDPRDGAVLALASSPGYSPAAFVPPRGREASRLVIDEGGKKPLFFRASQGTYPAGSVFKPFVAAGALQDVDRTGLTPASKIKCNGFITSGPTTEHRCEGIHGAIAVREAIMRSCNIYFYEAGRRMGPDRLAYWAREFGFGERTGIDLTGEAPGRIPDPEWKEMAIGEKWYLSETYHFSIGQGYVAVTPLQVARGIAAIANGGTLVRPYLNLDEGPSGMSRKVGVAPHILDVVRQGMVKVTADWGGTGRRAFDDPLLHGTASFEDEFPGIAVAGKSGSAEHGRKGRPAHAWFCGFAPAGKPTVAFALVLEEAGYGGQAAAPVAADMLAAYFRIFGRAPAEGE